MTSAERNATTVEEARARLRPGNFQGHAPRGRSHRAEQAVIDSLEGRWFESSRYRRRALVTGVEALTSTGTVRVGFEVADDEPFAFQPGQMVGIEAHFEGLGYRRSPYCILSEPRPDRTFDLLIREVPDGPLAQRLVSLDVGDEVAFRGPTGRSMVPPDSDRELVLLATGTGVAPFYSLARHLVQRRYPGPISLWWGLRLEEDVCLTEELDALTAGFGDFRYTISLSQPPPAWTGLRGRLGESVPPLLEKLGDKRYLLVGNGAMIEEMASALSDLGVVRTSIYKEFFFNSTHRPDPAVVAAIRERFRATDLSSLYARLGPDVDLEAARAGRTAHGDPLAVSELFDLLPAFLSAPQKSG